MQSGNPIEILAKKELIEKLRKKGYDEIIDCLLENEDVVYTKKGRLNKSSTCRVLSIKGKQLEDALAEMREILQEDLDL